MSSGSNLLATKKKKRRKRAMPEEAAALEKVYRLVCLFLLFILGRGDFRSFIV